MVLAEKKRWKLLLCGVGFRFQSSLSMSFCLICFRSCPPIFSAVCWVSKVINNGSYCITNQDIRSDVYVNVGSKWFYIVIKCLQCKIVIRDTAIFRFFRIVHGPLFIKNFASDRRHMRDSAGNWISEPPSYEAIVTEGIYVYILLFHPSTLISYLLLVCLHFVLLSSFSSGVAGLCFNDHSAIIIYSVQFAYNKKTPVGQML